LFFHTEGTIEKEKNETCSETYNETVKRGYYMMAELEFYDVETDEKFFSSNYKIIEKDKRIFAVSKSKNGTHDCWIVLKEKEKKE